MINCTYNQSDLRYVFYWGDNISSNTQSQKKAKRPSLEDYLNKIPSFMFLPSYSGIPHPEVFLNKFKKDDHIIYYTYAGLWHNVTSWCKDNNIELNTIGDFDKFKYTDMSMSLQDFTDYVNSWGLKYQPREYQYKAAWLILKYRCSMSQLATRAGKTLIAYIVFRYMLEHGAHNILMIVPNTTLVKQGVSDMSEYQEFFKTETVWSGGELCESSNLTIGTFQSLIKRLDKKSKKYDPKWFKKFDVVCCDECHTAKCESIKTLLTQDFLKFVKIKFGFSGTVPEPNTIESFQCQSLLGPKIQDIRSSELVEDGYLANVVVKQVYMHYPDNQALTQKYIQYGEYLNSVVRKDEDGKPLELPEDEQSFTMKWDKKLPFALEQCKKMYEPEEYKQYLIDCCKAHGSNLLMLEQMLLHNSPERLTIIDKIVGPIKKNVIVFAHHTEYLKMLEAHFKEKFPNRSVYLISGSTSPKKRETILKNLENETGAILCASYACCGTGLTFKNLDYGIFAQSFKSKTINLQSVGRGMLRTEEKDTFYLYDLVDCFPTKRLEIHGKEKRKLYLNESYTVLTKEVQL